MINLLKKLAKEFDLKFNEKWFKYLWISKRENILLEYLWMCPDPIYQKYGKGHEKGSFERAAFERAKQIEKFISSKEFDEKLLFRYGGQVIKKDLFEYHFPRLIDKIENLEIKEFYKKLYRKITKALGNYSRIAILTKSPKQNEIESLKTFVLLHEWIHILLEENDLRLRNWKYNEGLVTYFQEFAEENLNKLEEFRDKTGYNFQKQYYIYAIKFRNWLKDIKDPLKRKQKLLQLVKKYSK